MATKDLELNQTMLLDPADNWNLGIPVTLNPGDYVEIRAITEDLSPIKFDFGTQKLENSVPPGTIEVVWPLGVLRFIYDTPDTDSWWVQIAVEPATPRWDSTFTGWVPPGGTIGTAFVPVPLTLEGNKYVDPSGLYDFIPRIPGVYSYGFSSTMSHSKKNQDREAQIRLWNSTDGTPIEPPLAIFSDANSQATNGHNVGHFTIPSSLLGKLLRLEIGNVVRAGTTTPDSFTNVTLEQGSFCFHGIDPTFSGQQVV